MEFMIEPIANTSILPDISVDNVVCPENGYQCGCNTVAGCGCPAG